MQVRSITEDFAVCGQIAPDHVEAIAAHGFKSLICNRPDQEQPDQPSCESIAAAAKQYGLTFAFVPVASGALTMDNVTEMRQVLDTLPRPILAYCRSGARCAQLFEIASNQP